eukprot:6459881-Pyramimonas_sp.AAC.1
MQARLSRKVLELGWAEEFNVFERLFAISTPMMHSEDLELQNLGIATSTKWAEEYKQPFMYSSTDLFKRGHSSASLDAGSYHLQAGDAQAAGMMENSITFAKDHQRMSSTPPANISALFCLAQVIQRFGRFPSRNAAMGRECTPSEEKYINEEMTSGWEKSQASIGKK